MLKQINYMQATLQRLKHIGFWGTFFSKHISIWKFTIFGANAMHWSVTIHNTKWGHIHIDIPTFQRLIGKRGWKIYASPNGTPWACTWCIGTDRRENIRAQIRKLRFGHNPKMIAGEYKEGSELYDLNEKMDACFWSFK